MSDDYRIRTYDELPKSTRLWIDNLREEDIIELEEARKMVRSLKTVSSIWQKVFLAFFGAVITVGVASQYLGGWFKSLGQWMAGT